jgi:hypothetical protein
MSKPNSLAVQFPQLNQEIPEKLTLPQWQYLYREVIFSMGMRILQLFPQDPLGPNPFVAQSAPAAAAGGGAAKPGGHAGGPPPPPPPPPGMPPPFGPREDTGKGGPTGGPEPALSIAHAVLGLPVVAGKQT